MYPVDVSVNCQHMKKTIAAIKQIYAKFVKEMIAILKLLSKHATHAVLLMTVPDQRLN